MSRPAASWALMMLATASRYCSRNSESPSMDLNERPLRFASYHKGRGYDPVMAVGSIMSRVTRSIDSSAVWGSARRPTTSDCDGCCPRRDDLSSESGNRRATARPRAPPRRLPSRHQPAALDGTRSRGARLPPGKTGHGREIPSQRAPRVEESDMLLTGNQIRQDKSFDLLTEAILERDQPRTTDLFFRMVRREGRSLGDALSLVTAAEAPFVQVPSHINMRDGQIMLVNNDHTILG